MSDHDQLIAACARWEKLYAETERLYNETLASWLACQQLVRNAEEREWQQHCRANEAEDALRERCEEVERLRHALKRLVDLKDGPRDSVYHREKPDAWKQARNALAAAASVLPGEPQ